ncbi:MAG: hypothetical protein ACI89R_000677 [Candidatus Azotimanducaceae bacterium]|jgi:hypothetical protein
MKKIILITIISIVSLSTYAQEEKENHHEVKINAFNLLIFKHLEGSYEYLINSESSAGIAARFALNSYDDRNIISYNERYVFTGFYRRYFSKKYAAGFFVEGLTMYSHTENDVDIIGATSKQSSNDIALGFALGWKFVSKRGLALEFYGGIGEQITSSNDNVATEVIPRLGASIGYRF